MILEGFINLESEIQIITLRFLLNLVVITALVRGIYFHYKKDKEYAFTFFLFNVLIFFVCYLMLATNISMGFAFGLFAIFGILRYRTSTIPIKEMTYLFTSITIALINAIGAFDWIIVFMNVVILVFVFLMERIWFSDRERYITIEYEKIDLLQGQEELVLADLKKRTGMKITKFEVRSFNFLNDSATIRIYYTPDE